MSFWPRVTLWLSLIVLLATGFGWLTFSRIWTLNSQRAVATATPTGGALQPPPTVAEAVLETGARSPDTLSSARKRLAALALPEALRRREADTVGEAFEFLDRKPDEDTYKLYYSALLEFCVGQDPIGTMEQVTALADGTLREMGAGLVLHTWGQRDPLAALSWAADHPRGENDHRLYQIAYDGFALRQPLEALHALDQPAMASDLDELSRIVVYHFDDQNRLGEARAWIETLPEGNLRDLLALQTVHFWAKKSPEDAALWLANMASPDTFRLGMGSLVHSLAETEPHFAAGLTQQFPDPKIRQDYLADVIYIWGQHDLPAAVSWLQEQPAGPHLDAAIARMVETLVYRDPIGATQWAKSISDPKKREELLGRMPHGG